MLCRIDFKSLRYEGPFTPPSLQGSLVYPGNFGVFDWGGISVDPVRQIAFVNPSYMAFRSKLVPAAEVEGGPGRKSETEGVQPNKGAPYGVILEALLSPMGLPCQAPAWGYVAAVDLTTHQTIWKHKNGTVRDSSPVPIPLTMGVPSLGGTFITASGVSFLSATLDQYLRAYDVRNGKQLWEGRLPAGAQTTPMTYTGKDGKQYVLVVAGGHGSLGTKQGDYDPCSEWLLLDHLTALWGQPGDKAILRRDGNVLLIHRIDQVFDQRIEITAAQVHAFVRLSQAVAGVRARPARISAKLLHQLVAHPDDVDLGEVLVDTVIFCHTEQHAFDDFLDARTLTEVLINAVILGWLLGTAGHQAVAGVRARPARISAKLLHQFVAHPDDVDLGEVLVDTVVFRHTEQHTFDDPLNARTLTEVLINAVILGWLLGTAGQ
nr:hypothetical protein [Tanacetum cinerariifolium]